MQALPADCGSVRVGVIGGEVRPVRAHKTVCYLVHFADGTSEVLNLEGDVPDVGRVIVDGRQQPVWNILRRDRIEPKDPETDAEFELWVVQADLAGYVK